MKKTTNTFTARTHSFNVAVLTLLGFEETMLLQHFDYWRLNNSDKEFFKRDGLIWTYNTRKELLKIFPYMNETKITRVTEKLQKLGLIVKGNYNKLAYDKTVWYAITPKGIALFESPVVQNELETIGQSEPTIGQSEPSLGQSEPAIPNIASNVDSDIASLVNIEHLSTKAPDSPPVNQVEDDWFKQDLNFTLDDLANEETSSLSKAGQELAPSFHSPEGSGDENLDSSCLPFTIRNEQDVPCLKLRFEVASIKNKPEGKPFRDSDFKKVVKLKPASFFPGMNFKNASSLVYDCKASNKHNFSLQGYCIKNIEVLFQDKSGKLVYKKC